MEGNPFFRRQSKHHALQKHFRPAQVGTRPPAKARAGDIQGSLQQRMARICRSRQAPWRRFPRRGRIQSRLGCGQTSVRKRRRWRLAPEITFLLNALPQKPYNSNSDGSSANSLAILTAIFFSSLSKRPSEEAMAIIILTSKREASVLDFILPIA